MQKLAPTDHPIHDLLRARWSPRAFRPEPVAREDLLRLLEAARWAPSCFNEQPWRFCVATRDQPEAFERLAGALMEGNAWARSAGALVLIAAKTHFDRGGKPNRHAGYDCGAAAMSLAVEAQSLGLATHPMAGFDPEHARTALAIPDGFDPLVMIAVGQAGEPDELPEKLAEAERGPRARLPLSELAFGPEFGAAY